MAVSREADVEAGDFPGSPPLDKELGEGSYPFPGMNPLMVLRYEVVRHETSYIKTKVHLARYIYVCVHTYPCVKQ